MFWLLVLVACHLFSLGACSGETIIQNGQVKATTYPNTAIDVSAYAFHSYAANASELSYKGRWDSKKVSWWA